MAFYIFVNLPARLANYVSIAGGITNDREQIAMFESESDAQHIADAMPASGPECIVLRARNIRTQWQTAQIAKTRAHWTRQPA